MSQGLMYVGLDVDDNSFTGVGVSELTGEIIGFKSRPILKSLVNQLNKLRDHGFQLKICYESTYLGFSLARDLVKAGFECEVIAASLIPEVLGDRVKTDRLDAQNLAIYYMKGLLTVVSIPDEEDEVIRQLIRFRTSVRRQLTATKNKMRSEGKIFGITFAPLHNWTESTRNKTYQVVNSIVRTDLRDLLMFYIEYIDQQHEQLKRFDQKIEEYSKREKYQTTHDALVCLRGIKSLTAMTLISEIGDINRFNHPKKLASYIGFDITEYSSGGKEKKFGITKAGNKRLRTCLVETQQLLQKAPVPGRVTQRRRREAKSWILTIARRCDSRIYKRARHLMARGKHTNKIKVACARELVGFIWEIMKNSRVNQLSTAGEVS